MVEAAGIEPASEWAPPGASTCVAPLLISRRVPPRDAVNPPPAECFLALPASATVQASLLVLRPTTVEGVGPQDARCLLSSESVVLVGSYCCLAGGFTRTRHLDTQHPTSTTRRSQSPPKRCLYSKHLRRSVKPSRPRSASTRRRRPGPSRHTQFPPSPTEGYSPAPMTAGATVHLKPGRNRTGP